MSHKTKEEAWERALEIRRLLPKPDAWEIRVHENFGWHFTIYDKKTKGISVNEFNGESRKYIYFMVSSTPSFGSAQEAVTSDLVVKPESMKPDDIAAALFQSIKACRDYYRNRKVTLDTALINLTGGNVDEALNNTKG